MTPYEIKTEEEWTALLERFARETNMTACLTDEAGGMLQCRGDRYPLCTAIRDDKETLTFVCSQTSTAMLAVVRKTLKPAVDACEAGLLRVVVPLVRQGRLVGQVTACGVAAADEEPDTFLIAKQLGLDEDRVAELAQSTPIGSEEDLEDLARTLFDELNEPG